MEADTFSDADYKLFQGIVNAESVNIPRTELMQDVTEVDDEDDNFLEGVAEEEEEEDDMSAVSSEAGSVFSEAVQKQQEQQQAPRQKKTVPLTKLLDKTTYIPDDFKEIDITEENADPTVRREKQEILFQLLKKYPTESRGQWSMAVPLFELKYELKRREQHQAEVDQLIFMKELLKMFLHGVEVANRKFGPFLALDGWAESITRDMSRYDRPMKALYHKYFKRTRMNPMMELMWIIVGSAIMWHIQTKFTSRGPPQPTVHDIRPPPGEMPSSSASAPPGLNLGSILKLFS
jgi:hypothetical protein